MASVFPVNEALNVRFRVDDMFDPPLVTCTNPEAGPLSEHWEFATVLAQLLPAHVFELVKLPASSANSTAPDVNTFR